MDTWTVIIQMDMWTSRPNPSMSAIATNVSIKRETPRMELIKKKKTESEERTQLRLSNLMVMLLLQALMIDINVQLWTIKYNRVHQLTACI